MPVCLVAQGVCTAASGGLTAREGIAWMHSLTDLNIVAMHFNAVSPQHDVNEMPAFCAPT